MYNPIIPAVTAVMRTIVRVTDIDDRRQVPTYYGYLDKVDDWDIPRSVRYLERDELINYADKCNSERVQVSDDNFNLLPYFKAYSEKYNDLYSWIPSSERIARDRDVVGVICRNFYKFTYFCDYAISKERKERYSLTDYEVWILCKLRVMSESERSKYDAVLLAFVDGLVEETAVGGIVRSIHRNLVYQECDDIVKKMLEVDSKPEVYENTDEEQQEFSDIEINHVDCECEYCDNSNVFQDFFYYDSLVITHSLNTQYQVEVREPEVPRSLVLDIVIENDTRGYGFFFKQLNRSYYRYCQKSVSKYKLSIDKYMPINWDVSSYHELLYMFGFRYNDLVARSALSFIYDCTFWTCQIQKNFINYYNSNVPIEMMWLWLAQMAIHNNFLSSLVIVREKNYYYYYRRLKRMKFKLMLPNFKWASNYDDWPKYKSRWHKDCDDLNLVPVALPLRPCYGFKFNEIDYDKFHASDNDSNDDAE